MDRETARQEIRRRISCTAYLEKSKSGMYCCPFCGSGKGTHGTGAVKVYDTNTWTCHSCKKSGDVFDLMQEHFDTDFNGALAMAASELGIEIESYKASESPYSHGRKKNDISHGVTDKAAEKAPCRPAQTDYTAYYDECAGRLINSPEAIAYLQERGISAGTAAALHVGYDPEADPAGSGHKAPRIIMPTTAGHYAARSIDPNMPKAYRKMNNKGGTPGIFNVSVLHSDADIVFVTEGAFDAMSVCEMGEAAIALNSTSNAGRLVEYLKAGKEYYGRKPSVNISFVVAFDNDSDPQTAARTNKAAEDLCSGLQKLGYKSIVFNIAGGYKDANEALQAYRPAFADLLAKARKELVRDDLADFAEIIQTEAYRPCTTDLPFFDSLLGGGIIQQSLLVLMAAPGTGKTTLCQQIAEAMAAHRKQVIYLNLEMSREQMLAKAISGRLAKKGKAGKTALDILQGYRWTPEDRQLILAEIEDYRKTIYPYMQYNPGNIGSSLDGILGYLQSTGEKALAESRQAPALIVDYLHLISSDRGLDNQELLKQAVKGLKNYAIRYNTFVIAVSATNRVSNMAGRITMESGRDSSNIEYTGDYQLSLNYYAVDSGEVKTTDTEKLAGLQQMKWRQMIIRVLKGRFVTPGRSARVYFHAAGNLFYGENDELPADPERIPFRPLPRAGIRR